MLLVGRLHDDVLHLHLLEVQRDQGARGQVLPEGDDDDVVLPEPDGVHDFLIGSVGDDGLGCTVPGLLDGLLGLVNGNDLDAARAELLDEVHAEDAETDDNDAAASWVCLLHPTMTDSSA